MAATAKRKTFHAFAVETNDLKGGDAKDIIWAALTAPDHYSKAGVSLSHGTHAATGYRIEMRDIRNEEDSGLFMGAVCKCRADAPPLRHRDGTEVLQALQDGDTLLEKNYFLYARDTRTLIWQFNLTANSYRAFPQMLDALDGNNHAFACVPITLDAASITMTSQIDVVDFRVVAPRTQKARRALLA